MFFNRKNCFRSSYRLIKNLGKKEFLHSIYCHLFAISDWSKYKEKAQKINKNLKTNVCVIGSLEKNTHILYTYIKIDLC